MSSRTVYVVSYAPLGYGGFGGFDWYRSITLAHTRAIESLQEDSVGDYSLLFRSIDIPSDVDIDDSEAVTNWIDVEGRDLWDCVPIEGPAEYLRRSV